ncbi:MAG: LON peptidase substrate-binding domain-containing protein [Bdellovibrionales bacterium]|nr:LON peptidase substrate-binding domain-containing protein [Bdellovibrionales bacterium]
MSMIIPIFPLPVVALPDELVPLHIFEERYKLMIDECSQFTGIPAFGVTFIREDEVHRTGCLVTIKDLLYKYDNGASDIVVCGNEKFKLVNLIEDEKPYLLAEVKFIEDENVYVKKGLRDRAINMHEKLIELLTREIRILNLIHQDKVSYLLGANAGLEDPQKQTLLELSNENDRLECLVDHYLHTIDRVRTEIDLENHLKLNGYLH